MADMSQFERTVQVSSNIVKNCEECNGREADMSGDVSDKVNHYLEHGYQLLHVGPETSHGDEGLWHSTVALLGKPRG